jgi:broad specificity phosphatase PhoE
VLILVRHATPAFEETVSPTAWPLSPDGRTAARALSLPTGAVLAASDEVKAYQTLEHLGEVQRDPRFGEVHRVGEPWNGPYRELRRSYVEGAALPGWEPQGEVAARFDQAIAEFLVRAGGRPLAVATHGMVMTVWLRSRDLVRSPGEFWAALDFPDALVVDLSGRTVERL